MDVLVLIDKLDELVLNARGVPMSNQVRLDRDEIEDIISHMRATIPEEIKQARWIVKERQEMLAEAKREAERMIGEARDHAAREASQQEVVKLAERQAEDVLADARRKAREMRLGCRRLRRFDPREHGDEPDQVPVRGAARSRAAFGPRATTTPIRPRLGSISAIPSSVATMTLLDLRRYRLEPGESREVTVPVECELGGARRPRVRRRPPVVDARLRLQPSTDGLYMRLRFAAV